MRDISELNINEGGHRVERPAPSKEVIKSFQAYFSVTLPEEYLKLLRYSSGGCPERDSIQPGGRPWATRWGVDHFYHLDNDKSSFQSLWTAMKVWRPILGKDILVFAEDGGGNQFFLDLSKSPATVKVCAHDENFAIVDLAPSFEAFIDGLSLDPDCV